MMQIAHILQSHLITNAFVTPAKSGGSALLLELRAYEYVYMWLYHAHIMQM